MTGWELRANNGDGKFAIAVALLDIAKALYALGNGNAATQMGAIEAFGDHIGKKLDDLTGALHGMADMVGTLSPPDPPTP
jgi:hypothetical protein